MKSFFEALLFIVEKIGVFIIVASYLMDLLSVNRDFKSEFTLNVRKIKNQKISNLWVYCTFSTYRNQWKFWGQIPQWF